MGIQEQDCIIKLIDVSGKILIEEKVTNSNYLQIPIHQYSNGIYFIQFQYNQTMELKKIMINQ
ncbi:MAG: hypothetical protein CMP65_04745 [Flavobacteriales bacterium]|nr:hypothetical protein [Flavobacteriales bacterium]